MKDLIKIATAVSVVIAVVKIVQSRTVCVYGPGFKVCNK